MTKNQSQSNKASTRPKRSNALPALGIALNWVPPKTPVPAPAPSREKKRRPETR